MQTLLTIVHVIVAVFLCLVVLLQSGRGGGMGAAFGGAGSQIFGGRGAGNFLTKLTSGAAIIFFITSLTLSMLSSRHSSVVVGKPATPEGAVESEKQPGEETPVDGQKPEAAPEQPAPGGEAPAPGSAPAPAPAPAAAPDQPQPQPNP